MTRQEPTPTTSSRLCKRPRPWLAAGKRGPLREPPASSQPTSSKKASQSSSQGRSASKPASSRRPASQPVSSQSGAKVRKQTNFFFKTRKMTSLGTSPRRKPSVPRARAHCNGLRGVKEARTRPLLPPEIRWLAAPLSSILRNFLVFCGNIWSVCNIFRQKH